ncbi:MAG: hypothetical protein ACLSDQ_11830 [Adlercreutzia equolifaciens]
MATSRMGSVADAEDVFQTVFMRLLQSRAVHRRRASEGVAARDDQLLQRRAPQPLEQAPRRLDDATLSTLRASELDEPGREAPDDAGNWGNLEPGDLAAALARLHALQRTAVHLFYFEGYATTNSADHRDAQHRRSHSTARGPSRSI